MTGEVDLAAGPVLDPGLGSARVWCKYSGEPNRPARATQFSASGDYTIRRWETRPMCALLLDGEELAADLPAKIVTNDPLNTAGRAYLRGEPTNAVFFGLFGGEDSDTAYVQQVVFELID